MDHRKGSPRREEDREILEMRQRLELAERQIREESQRNARMEAMIEEDRTRLQSHLLSCAASSGRLEVEVKSACDGVDRLNGLVTKVLLATSGTLLAALLSLGVTVFQSYIK